MATRTPELPATDLIYPCVDSRGLDPQLISLFCFVPTNCASMWSLNIFQTETLRSEFEVCVGQTRSTGEETSSEMSSLIEKDKIPMWKTKN